MAELPVSAGLLPWRGDGQVLLGRMGGPLWVRRERAWSVVKGLPEAGETLAQAAAREWVEETGLAVPSGEWVDLGEVLQSRKVVRAWAVAGDVALDGFASRTFTMEWPPRSGQQASFPELAELRWLDPGEAAEVMVLGQVPLLERLASTVTGR